MESVQTSGEGNFKGVLFIQTGGVIDMRYSQASHAYDFQIDEAAVSRVLAAINPSYTWRLLPLFHKAGQDLTNLDRTAIAERCLDEPERIVIVTHGLVSLLETAEEIARVGNFDDLTSVMTGHSSRKTIVLTGAAVPESSKGSDAAFNIGSALAAALCRPAGVYIAMNGWVMAWDNCQRDEVTGRFEPIKPDL